MSSRVSHLLGGLAPSATLAVGRKAKAMKAAGEPVIGYGAGEPDFATPVHIVEAAAKACYDPVNYKYTPTAGLAELRDAIVAKSMRDSGLATTGGQVLVTNGGKHAVITACMTLLNPGDEVLIPAPFWTTYPEAVYLAGGKAVAVMTDEANGFRVSIDELDGPERPDQSVDLYPRRRTPPGQSRVPTRSPRSAGGPRNTTSGSCATRYTNTSPTAMPECVDAGRRARIG